MKLYTEEQVRQMLSKARGDIWYSDNELFATQPPIELPSDSLCINCDESKSTHNVCMDCMIKIGKENIELPSDEEISEESMDLYGKLSASLNDVLQYKAFKRGAKWVLNKIQGEDDSLSEDSKNFGNEVEDKFQGD